MSRRSFRVALAIVLGTLVVLGIVVAVVVDQALDYPYEKQEGEGVEVAVVIEGGMAFSQIAARLEERGVVDDARWFRLYAMHRGATNKVRAGEYVLRDDMAPVEVLDTLLEGVEEETVAVTIPEGLHMLEVFAILEEAGVADADELEALGRDAEFLARHGISGHTVEGYLFPETYRFQAPTPPEVVLDILIKQHRIVWDQVRREHVDSIEKLRKKLGWSDHEFLIMASIVEKESVVDEERPRIAQVFMNRLLSPNFVPHQLDTDPTIRYGCMVPLEKSEACKAWDPTQRLRRAQLDDKDNPYNTYQHEGLPPGPIGNPGRASLEAVANPDGSNYFYFVSRNDGTHVFSRTFAEHDRAVDRYQR